MVHCERRNAGTYYFAVPAKYININGLSIFQDFNYIYSNCFELTIELSCCKYPPKEKLQTQWNYNKEALLSFLEVVQTGVRGIVTDEKGEPLPNANIEISGISGKNITTSYFGEYWRLLAPGNYW